MMADSLNVFIFVLEGKARTGAGGMGYSPHIQIEAIV
jgi:hypothetical protein